MMVSVDFHWQGSVVVAVGGRWYQQHHLILKHRVSVSEIGCLQGVVEIQTLFRVSD